MESSIDDVCQWVNGIMKLVEISMKNDPEVIKREQQLEDFGFASATIYLLHGSMDLNEFPDEYLAKMCSYFLKMKDDDIEQALNDDPEFKEYIMERYACREEVLKGLNLQVDSNKK